MQSNGNGYPNGRRYHQNRIALFILLAAMCVGLAVWLIWSSREKEEHRRQQPGNDSMVRLKPAPL
jgi:hypothetical protein